MRYGIRATAAIVVALFVTVAPAAASPASLATQLGKALQHHGLGQAKVSALVVRADDGGTLFEQEPDRLLTPASNAKILTALASLMVFGPTHRFTTRIYSDGPPDPRGSVQNLVVVGGGDPSLTSEQWWRLADDLRLRGLRQVRGDLLLDDAWFDAVRWHPAWGNPSSRAYHSPVGALSANYGSFAVHVLPGRANGAAAEASIDPPVSYLQLENEARTGPAGVRTGIEVTRQATGGTAEKVTVSGVIAQGAEPRVVQRSVIDPLPYAGAVLRLQLAAQGIGVGGTVRRFRLTNSYSELLAFQGEPLAEIVRLFMKYSNNNIAESLIKAMGAQAGGGGTWEAGLAVLRDRLVQAGIDGKGFHLVDGSGLAVTDRVSPRTFVQALLVGRRSFSFGPEFLAAMPIAARDGTLSHRAAGARDLVRAKTGLLSNAVGLSGFARLRDGGEVAFSILVNDYRHGGQEAMAALDAFVTTLVGGAGS